MQQPKKRTAIRGNQFEEVKDSEIDYELPSGNSFFGSHTNLVPIMQNVASPRVFYGARFFNQAVPLTNPEAPLVQSAIDGDPDGKTFEDWAGDHSGNVRARNNGVIKKVSKDGIQVVHDDGTEEEYELYNKMPFNRKTSISNIPLVKPGDQIKKGGLIARSNYTSDKGELALGTNAEIAMVPYKGMTMDDAIAISQDFAKKLTSEQVLGYDHEKKGDIKTGLNHFITLFPQKYTKDQLKNVTASGAVKEGTILNKGDPIILGTAPRIISSGSQQLGKLSRHMLASRKDATQIWDYDNPGEVLDVVETNAGIKLNIRSELPAQVGDKLVIRNGQKGIISQIIPQEHMPRKMDGTPLEVLLNPLGLPSRVNSSTLYEMLLGKIAVKTGVPYKLPQFNKLGEKTYDFVESELAKNGLTDTEEIFDPKENRKLENLVTVGNANVLKLYHIAENKLSARSFGAYDTTAQQPLKGGDEAAGSKRISGLESTALMGAGAYNILREVATIRGTRCFDTSSEVLTKRGWVNWGSVLTTDELLTRSNDNPNISWYEQPKALVQYQFNGELMGYEGRHLNWLVTPDHRFYGVPTTCSKNKPYYNKRFYTAEYVYEKDAAFDAFGSIYKGTLDLNTIIDTKDFPGIYNDNKVKHIKMSITDYCRLLGWWLSEGDASISSSGVGEIGISQSKNVNPKEFTEIEELLKRIGLENIVYRKIGINTKSYGANSVVKTPPIPGDIVGMRVRCRPLAEHLLTLGNRSYNKRLPELLFEAPLEARLEFLRCYVAGDGAIRFTGDAEQNIISSSSKQMIDDIARLAIISGFGAFPGVCNGNYKRPHYRLIFSKNITTVSSRKKPSAQYKGYYKQQYNGTVYCATMSTGMLYVRREGKAMWSGNCDDYWRQVRMGQSPQSPREPFAWNKFKALIVGAGFHADEIDKDKLRLAPMTDAKLKKLGPLEVKSGGIINFNDMSPVKEGLFDQQLTTTNKWGVIPLDFKIPNPAFESHIQKLLGLTKKELLEILSGNSEYGGLKGPKAIEKALNELDVDKLKEESIEAIRKKQVSKRPLATQRLQYLIGMEKNGIKPQDLLIQNVPVIPAKFRPFSIAGETFISGDANELYKDLINIRNAYRDTKNELGEDGARENILHVYNAAKAVYGYGDPVNVKSQERGVSGFLSKLTGESPKFSFLNRKLLSKTVDLSGRAVITVDPELGMDQIAIPEEMGWKILQPFVQKRLVNKGLSPAQALIAVRDQTPIAKTALYLEAKERPVMYSRAPVWHKGGTLAGYAKLTPGKNIAINSLVTTSLNADFDGNCIVAGTKLLIRIDKNKENVSYSKLLLNTADSQIMEIAIENFPYVKDKFTFDKNGSKIHQVPDGISVLTNTTDGKGSRWSKVDTFTVDGIKEIKKITTYSGKDVSVSSNESIAIYEHGCKIARIAPDNIILKRHIVPVLRGMPEHTANDHSKDFGWLLGAFVSDGWIDENDCLGYTKVDDLKRARFIDAVHAFIGSEINVRLDTALHTAETNCGISGQSTKVHLDIQRLKENAKACELIAILKSCYHTSKEFKQSNERACLFKKLPSNFLGFSKKDKLDLLAGLFDGDGGINLNTSKSSPQVVVTYSTSSPYLRDDVILLLSSLGIRSSVTITKTKPGRVQKVDNYSITVSTPDLAIFANDLNCTTKSNGLEYLIKNGVAKDDRDIVPIDFEILEILTKNTPDGMSKGSFATAKSACKELRYTTISRNQALRIIESFKGDKSSEIWTKWISIVKDRTLCWETITNIESKENCEVFDIGVPETKVFALSNGLIIYDTINVHSLITPEAIKDAKEKLMPSKMLFGIRDEEQIYNPPKQEQVLGLYLAKHSKAKHLHTFPNVELALEAIKAGKVSLSDEINISS